LVGSSSTISNTVRVPGASLAAEVSHAIVTVSSGSAAVVICWGGRCVTSEGIYAKSIGSADGVGTSRRRTIVGGAVVG